MNTLATTSELKHNDDEGFWEVEKEKLPMSAKTKHYNNVVATRSADLKPSLEAAYRDTYSCFSMAQL
ncbi:MAG: hypothetical protein MI975_14610 [Cytophagales bacterium]|nr:hypothetical protein [Cytophagales bacterium]